MQEITLAIKTFRKHRLAHRLTGHIKVSVLGGLPVSLSKKKALHFFSRAFTAMLFFTRNTHCACWRWQHLFCPKHKVVPVPYAYASH